MTTSLEQDAQLDRLNDQGLSYTQAYAQLGLTPPSAESVSAPAMEAGLARRKAHEENLELYRLTGPINLSPEQIAANALHFEAIRQANQQRAAEK